MRKALFAALVVTSFAVVGCTKDDDMDHDNMHHKMSSTQPMAGKDACAHCPGIQTATADGKCPVCGMKVQ